MKPRVALIILLASLVGLLLLIKAIPAKPVVIPTPTVATTLTATTVAPSRTPLPSPSPTATGLELTATETPTLTATVAPSPTQPLIEGSVEDYQLTAPPFDALLDLYEGANQWGLSECFSDDYSSARNWIISDAQSLQDATGFTLKRAYPQGLPDPQQILKLNWVENCSLSTPDLAFLTDAAWDYFKDQRWVDGSELSTPDFNADVHKVELDGDPGSEWLLYIPFQKHMAVTWLTLDEVAPGQYRRLNSTGLLPVQIYIAFGGPYIQTIQDVTGDGLSDLVIAEEPSFSSAHSSMAIAVLQGGPDGFTKLFSRPTDFYHSMENLDGASIDSDKSGHPYLQVSYSTDLNWGCTWQTETDYSWWQHAQQHTTTGEKMPDTPECAVAQAVSLSKPPNNLTAIQLLEGALRSFAIVPPEFSTYPAFVHYRLAVLYALEGQEASARRHLEWLQNYADALPTTDVKEFIQSSVKAELTSPKVNPVRLCDTMQAQAYLFSSEFPYFVDWSSVFGVDYPPNFCPLEAVLQQTLPKLRLRPDESPVAGLTQAGYPVIAQQQLGAQVWAVVLKFEHPRIVIVANGRIQSVAFTFEQLRGAKTLSTLNTDLTEDGLEDYAVAYPAFSYECTDQVAYDIAVVIPQDQADSQLVSGVACFDSDEDFNLPTLLADLDGDGQSDWVKAKQTDLQQGQHDPAWLDFDSVIAIESYETETSELDQLDQAFYQSTHYAQTRALLQKALAAVPANDPHTSLVRQHLNYFIALTYELEGNEALAVQTYFSVWADSTHTLWGNLAALHLQHK